MKQTPLILSIVSIIAVIGLAIVTFTRPSVPQSEPVLTGDSTAVKAQKGDIVYIELDQIIVAYDKYNDMRSTIEAKAQSMQNDIQRRGKQFETEATAFQNKLQKGLITKSVAEAQQKDLIQKEQELNQYISQKQYEIQEEEFVMNNTIMDDIKTFLAKYNETKGYALILSNTEMTNSIIIGNDLLDITEEVIAGLNEEYIKTKNK